MLFREETMSNMFFLQRLILGPLKSCAGYPADQGLGNRFPPRTLPRISPRDSPPPGSPPRDPPLGHHPPGTVREGEGEGLRFP